MRWIVLQLVFALLLISSTCWANQYGLQADSTILSDQSMNPTYGGGSQNSVNACGTVLLGFKQHALGMTTFYFYRYCGVAVSGVFVQSTMFKHECGKDRSCPPPSGYLIS